MTPWRPELKTQNSNIQSSKPGLHPGDLSVVLVAHGDQAGPERNQALKTHCAQLAATGVFRSATAGVLKGRPDLEQALDDACATGPDAIAIYPFFMADGYFVKTVLPQRLREFGLKIPYHILQPLGLEPNLVHVIVEQAVETARNANIDAKAARLLLVGHGSKHGPASANATRAQADAIVQHCAGVFDTVAVAFLEEAPFLSDQLATSKSPTVVSGFFNGDGLHAGEDVPNAIQTAPGQIVYTGPVGAVREVTDLIQSAILASVAPK